MKKVIDFVKNAFNVSKAWVLKNGVEGVAGLFVGLGLWAFGYKVWAGFAFGVFATRNWDILKAWVLSKLNK
jgi:hypothetical protein